jgi:hypothetical protein
MPLQSVMSQNASTLVISPFQTSVLSMPNFLDSISSLSAIFFLQPSSSYFFLIVVLFRRLFRCIPPGQELQQRTRTRSPLILHSLHPRIIHLHIMYITLDIFCSRYSISTNTTCMVPEFILFFFRDPAFDKDISRVLWAEYQ